MRPQGSIRWALPSNIGGRAWRNMKKCDVPVGRKVSMPITRMPGKLIPVILMLSSIFGLPPRAGSAPTRALTEGNTVFALDLYGQLKTSPGNLFFSPYSISTALAMTCAGARGDTEKQMAKVLHFDQEQRQV